MILFHRTCEALSRARLRLGVFAVVFFVCATFTDAAPAQNRGDRLSEHLHAAETALVRGDQQRAAQEYKLFLIAALHQTGNAKARSGDFPQAQRDYAAAAALSPDDVPIQLDYARAALDAGDLATAAMVAERLTNLEPRNADFHLLYARILIEQQKGTEAKAQLHAIAPAGRSAQFDLELAHAYLKLQDLSAAEEVFRHLLAEWGDKASTHLQIGVAYYYGDYPQEAVKELEKAAAEDPKGLDIHYYLGLASLGHNEEAGFARATNDFRQELKNNPEDWRSHFMLGYIFLKQREFTEAEHQLLKAANLNPGDRGTKLLLGQLYEQTGRPELAEQELKNLIAESQKEGIVDTRLVRAHYILGRILQKTGHVAEGVDEIKLSEKLRERIGPAAIQSGNRDQGLFVASGTVSGRKANPRDKEEAENFVRKMTPAIAEVYNNLGSIAASQKDFARALDYFLNARRWDPNLQGLDENLARTKRALNSQ